MKKLNKTQINKAINFLNDNEIIILPTDTIYGLSSKVNDQNQLKINNFKKSDSNKKIIILFSKFNQLKNISLTKEAKEILNTGKQTLIINNNLGDSVAIRKTFRKDVKKIINKVGPIFSTSVNITGQKNSSTLEEFEKMLDKDKIFFTEPLLSRPSRIYDLITGKFIR